MSGRAPDVIIVGAGIIGAAVAYELTRDGHAVLVLDAGFPGAGATAGGMGHIVAMDDSDAQFALTSWSRRLLEQLRPQLPAECEFDACGTLWIAETEAELEAARRKQAYCAERGIATELLDELALRSAEPGLRHGLAGALRVSADAVVYPPALARWLLDRAAAQGATVRPHTRCVALETQPELAVRCASGARLTAAVVVNAAGAAAPLLSPGLDIVPRKGHLIVTDRYPGFCHHQLVELGYLQSAHTLSDFSVAFNVQPRTTGQLLIGSSRELVGWDAAVNRTVVSRMLARAVHYLPGVATLNALRTWTAFRPATRDHLPYIGPWAPQPGVLLAAGHEGLGITTALATARLLSDLIAGRRSVIDAAPYSPARALAAPAHA